MVVEPTTNPHRRLKCTQRVEVKVGGVAARTPGGSEKSTQRVDLRRRPRRLRVGSAVCHESGGRGGERGRARKLRCRSRGSRTLEGSDGVGNGWMDHPPAHHQIPTILTSLPLLGEDFVGLLHPCKERRKLREGRGEEGAAAAAPPPRWAGSATSSFFRYIGFCRFQLVGKHPALWLVLGCIFDVPGLVVTATSKWLDRSGSGRCGREEASSVEEPRSKFLANLDCFGDPSRIVHFRDHCMWRFSLVGAEASGRRGNPHSNCRLDCFGSPSTTHCGRSCIFFRSPQL